jgi:hypothetical protein
LTLVKKSSFLRPRQGNLQQGNLQQGNLQQGNLQQWNIFPGLNKTSLYNTGPA